MTDISDEKEIEVPIEDNEHVEVVLEDETSPKGKMDEREKALLEVKSQLEEVNRRHEQEKIARHRAEQYALEQAKVAQSAQADLHSSNYKVVLSGIENMQQTIEQAKRTYSDAMAAGDYNGVAEANNIIAWANANLKDLIQGKNDIEAYLQTAEGRVADQQPAAQAQYQQPPLTPEQKFNDMLSRLPPKSAAWLREHPSAAEDMNRLSAAHNSATVLKGLPAESPEYFSFIESELGLSSNRSAGRKHAMASTPVSSSGTMASRSGAYSGGSTMTLSAAEVEQAVLNDPDLPRDKAIEQYARNKAQLIREGKMSA